MTSIFQSSFPTADPKIQTRVRKITSEIETNNPDYVCLLGPVALQMLGKQLVSKGYTVISAGVSRFILNKFFTKEPSMYFVTTQNEIEPLKDFLKTYGSNIKHGLVFVNPDIDPIYFTEFMHFASELSNFVETEVIYVTTYQQFLSWLNQYGYKPSYIIGLLVPALKDTKTNTMLSDIDIIRKSQSHNYRATLLSVNRELCELGVNLCYGPDYYVIGQKVAKYIISSPRVQISNTSLSPELSVSPKLQSRIKIAIINSYSLQDPCGRPQQLGFIYELTHTLPTVKWHIENYYMQTKTVNTTVSQIKAQAQYALDFVNREVQPDFVFTTDDNAFNYVGTVLSHDKYVVFSGINKPFTFYEKLCDKNNVAGVEESLGLDRLFKLVKMSGVPIDTVAILLSEQPSLTEQGLTSLVLKVASKYKFKHITLYNNSVEEFIDNVKRLNSRVGLMLFCPISKLYSFSERKYYSMLQLNKLLVKYNKRHLEFTINPIFCEMAGLSVCEGPDFYEMGKLAASMVVKTILTGKFEHKVVRPKTKLVCNYRRLHQLGYDFLYDNFSDEFDEIY